MVISNKRFTYLFTALFMIVLWGFIFSVMVSEEFRYVGIWIFTFVYSMIICYCEYLVFNTTNIYKDYIIKYITAKDFFDCYKLSASISAYYIHLHEQTNVINDSDIMKELKEISRRKRMKFQRDLENKLNSKCGVSFKNDIRRYNALRKKLKDEEFVIPDECKELDEEAIDNLLHTEQMKEFAAFAHTVIYF